MFCDVCKLWHVLYDLYVGKINECMYYVLPWISFKYKLAKVVNFRLGNNNAIITCWFGDLNDYLEHVRIG